MNVKVPERFKSRKFIVAIVTVIAVSTGLIPEAAIDKIVGFLMVYLGGQSVVDAADKLKTKK